MYSNMCFEDVAAARRSLDEVIDNCDASTKITSDVASVCLLERLRVAQTLMVSVEEAIREEL